MERQEVNASAIAELLRARDDVEGVRWPGMGTVVCFDLGSETRAQAFLSACEARGRGDELAACRANAERRATGGAPTPREGFIRLSVGIEDTADLVADVERALKSSGR